MDKENEKSKSQQEKGTENLLLHSDNSMEGKAKTSSDISGKDHEVSDSSSKVIVCVSRNGKTPASDRYIMCDILSRLRSKHLMRLKSVCTQWKSLIETDSYLIDLHRRFHSRQMKTVLFVSSPPIPRFDESERTRRTMDFTTLSPTEVQKLEPDRPVFGIPTQAVAGLVCIQSRREAFLIYNPNTRERTPWIETTTVNENVAEERRRQVNCIAFGYSPRTKEHKVLCISSIKKKGVVRGLTMYIPSMPYTLQGQVFCMKKFADGKKTGVFEHADDIEEVGADEEQVCEVFTIGENTWRRIDAVPPYSLASKVCYVGELGHYNEESKAVYVRGKIYWRFRYTRKGEVMMVFDVRTEKFKVISIPEHVTRSPKKYPQTVELLEVDGHIAVLKFTPDCPISLWILNQDDGTDKWSYEKVRTPCDWSGIRDLSIEAISGSNVIIMKREMSETIYDYFRDRKAYDAYTMNEKHGLNYQPGELRGILSLFDSLAPVSTKRCSMF
ncbi:hypothetical protein MKX03_037531 [Papaver bracteatum]|nr:hypothetical protein MKX03_037531 [Papaver bracteatum]